MGCLSSLIQDLTVHRLFFQHNSSQEESNPKFNVFEDILSSPYHKSHKLFWFSILL